MRLFIALLLFLVLAPVYAQAQGLKNTTYTPYECEISTTKDSIFLSGTMFMYVALFILGFYIRSPLCRILIGIFIIVDGFFFYSGCTAFLEYLFLVLGMISVIQGIGDIGRRR